MRQFNYQKCTSWPMMEDNSDYEADEMEILFTNKPWLDFLVHFVVFKKKNQLGVVYCSISKLR